MSKRDILAIAAGAVGVALGAALLRAWAEQDECRREHRQARCDDRWKARLRERGQERLRRAEEDRREADLYEELRPARKYWRRLQRTALEYDFFAPSLPAKEAITGKVVEVLDFYVVVEDEALDEVFELPLRGLRAQLSEEDEDNTSP